MSPAPPATREAATAVLRGAHARFRRQISMLTPGTRRVLVLALRELARDLSVVDLGRSLALQDVADDLDHEPERPRRHL